jgi:hypothetical protein
VTGSSILRALAELLTESYAEEPPTDARRDWLREIVGNARDELDALRKGKPSDAWLADVRELADWVDDGAYPPEIDARARRILDGMPKPIDNTGPDGRR